MFSLDFEPCVTQYGGDMGVSFRWRPTKDTRPFRYGTSTDCEALKRAFGNSPWTLGPDEIAILSGMDALAGEKSIYHEILDAIDGENVIIVTAEY